MIEILAKSDPKQTLVEHVHDCLVMLHRVLEWKRLLLESFCNRCNVSFGELHHRLFLVIAFHDAGKIDRRFQEKIQCVDCQTIRKMGSGKTCKKHSGGNYRESHPLSSLVLLKGVLDNPLLKFKGYFPELFTVATHHTMLVNNTYDTFDEWESKYITDYLSEYFQQVNNWAKEFGVKEHKQLQVSQNTVKELPVDIFSDLRESISVMRMGIGETDYQLARDAFVLIKGILHYCDWLASKANDQQHSLSVSYSIKKQVDSQMSIKYGGNWKKKFQAKAQETEKDLFIEIPTGQGKTEAALLWAERFNKKVIYLLPTMVTSNKMYRRLIEFYGKETVGLAHSTASYVFHKQQNDESDIEEISDQDIREKLLYSRTFLYPATVSTVDQLLFSFFNWKHWTLTNLNAYNACIILDEIHAYEAFTFGLIVAMIKNVKRNNANVCLMSATLPEVLKRKLYEVLGNNTPIVKDTTFDTMQRTKIHIQDGYISSAIEAIKTEYQNGQKVLVICNTITKAREIYAEVKGFTKPDERLLFHSQFIGRDKEKKERILESLESKANPYVCVATQIVEVSLDIDFDVMFTENAPIDALVQRMGRVNRRNKKEIAPVFIYKESEKSRKYVYDPLILDATKRSLLEYSEMFEGNLNESHYGKIVNKVYNQDYIESNGWQKSFSKGEGFFDGLWKDMNIIYSLSAEERELQGATTREINYLTIEVVLQQYLEDLQQLIINKQYDLLPEISVRVPAYFVIGKNNKLVERSEFGKRGIPIIKCDYSPECGVEFKDDEMNFV
jgi:CRISPR-associated endonuclease/helicase Cas3